MAGVIILQRGHNEPEALATGFCWIFPSLTLPARCRFFARCKHSAGQPWRDPEAAFVISYQRVQTNFEVDTDAASLPCKAMPD